MSATQLHAAGYTDLVSVIPPGAEISPNSKVDPAMLGKCPGKKGKQGWFGYAFTKDKVDPAKIERWGANVGLLGDQFPALDIDTKSQKLTDVVLRVAANTLGRAPCRLSVEPRRLLVYRTDHSFARMAMTIKYQGETHLIEFLGKGRQYLVHGTHPSGERYRWCNEQNGWEPDHSIGDLWDIVPEELPRIDADMVRGFFETLRDGLVERGVECEIIGDGKEAAEKAPPQEELLAPDLHALREVVESIPNTQETSPDREHYLQMGYAIKAASGIKDDSNVTVFDIWGDWCRKRDPDDRVEGNPETWERDWSRMQPPYRVGWSWLQEQAEKWSDYYGAADEFEADPELEYEAPEVEEDEPEDEQPPISVTDEGVARVVAKVIGDKVRFVSVNNEWHIWNGYAWALDQRNEVYTLVRQVLARIRDALLQQAERAPQRERRRLQQAADGLQSRRAIENAVKLMTYTREINCVPEEFDGDPWILNTPGKLIVLKDDSVEVRDNDARFMCAKSTAVAPAAGPAAMWLKFLYETTEGDEELIDYLQKFCGYCLSGSTVEQFLPYVHGRSNTGKSVFLKTIAGIMGTYWKPASLEMLQATRETRHPAEIAELAGARLVTATETQEGRPWDEQRVKAMTAGDSMQVHKKFGHPFTLHPTFKIVVAGNHEPTIKNLDDAMMRRLHVVPFDHVVPVEFRDEALASKLEDEWPQILRWMLEGYVKWRRDKLQPPTAVQTRTGTYFDEEDLIGQWLDEECEVGEAFWAYRRTLYSSWLQWCNERGYDPGTFKTFGRKLRPFTDRGIRDGTVGPANQRGKGNFGVRVKPAIEGGIDGDFD